MPVKNELIGGYHCVLVANKFVLCDKVTRTHSIKAQPKPLMQGTIKTRIMEIGGLEEKIQISAPVLIGGGSLIDGRTLLNDQITNALLKTGATLPLLEQATITINADSGANISFVLQSDGNPANTTDAFAVTDHPAEQLTDGNLSDLLNPSVYNATRVATFYDFRVSLGTFIYFIMEAKIEVKTKIEKKYFIPGVEYTDAPLYTEATTDDTPFPDGAEGEPDLNVAWGTMYPWIAVSGLEISGTGKAAVLLNDQSGNYYFSGAGESYNYDSTSQLTIQQPGWTNTANVPFQIQVWQGVDPSTGEVWSAGPYDDPHWVSLFADSEGNALFDLSESIVTQTAVDINPGIMTSEFNFYCYII